MEEQIRGTLSTAPRIALFVESEGTLDDHEEAMRQVLDQARADHGHAAIESVSLSTVVTEANLVRYSSIVIVQIGETRF